MQVLGVAGNNPEILSVHGKFDIYLVSPQNEHEFRKITCLQVMLAYI